MIVAAAGSALVAGAVALTVVQSGIGAAPSRGDTPRLSSVPQKDIADAVATLTPSAAAPLMEDAKRCRIPLAEVVVSRGTAATGSVFRIRSGNYLSPLFTVSDVPQRIAIPYPSPYGSASGTILLDGTANGAVIGLSPAQTLTSLPGEQTIPVVWRPITPC